VLWEKSCEQQDIPRLITVARWPNFPPNSSKEAPKNCPCPEAVNKQNLAKSSRKEAEKYFQNYSDEKPYTYLYF
jgi:hypothetical protein